MVGEHSGDELGRGTLDRLVRAQNKDSELPLPWIRQLNARTVLKCNTTSLCVI